MKEYKGWQIAKMICEGDLKEGDLIQNRDGDTLKVVGHHLRCKGDNYQKELGSSYFGADYSRYTIIQKPVTFMEVVNSKMQCRVEYEKFNVDTNYFSLNDILNFLTEKNFDVKEIILNSQWYLEEIE